MAQTQARTALTPQIWDDEYFVEYVRESRFKRYMGTGVNSIFQVKEDLTKKKGDTVTFAYVHKLNGAGRTGNQPLEGYEEAVDSRAMTVRVGVLRHAISISDWDEQKSAIDLRDAGRDVLKMWSMERLRDDIISAFSSIDGTAYASASESAKDTWLASNADRCLFGASKSNNSSNDHSASLANIDNTNDKLTTANISLMKRMAQTASPKIRPIKLREDEEWYVLFANSLAFRDLAASSTMQQANRDARPRDIDSNPLFTGGSLVWDGVIIREIPEIPVYSGVGAGGIDVAPNFLVGAQAIGMAWAQRTKTTTNVRDYDFLHGIGLQEIRGIEKLRFGTDLATENATLKDHGVATLWASAVADA